MYFAIGSFGAWGPYQNTPRIQNKLKKIQRMPIHLQALAEMRVRHKLAVMQRKGSQRDMLLCERALQLCSDAQAHAQAHAQAPKIPKPARLEEGHGKADNTDTGDSTTTAPHTALNEALEDLGMHSLTGRAGGPLSLPYPSSMPDQVVFYAQMNWEFPHASYVQSCMIAICVPCVCPSVSVKACSDLPPLQS